MTDDRPDREILLGPRSMLHNGIHGALCDVPPPGIRYRVTDAAHVFALPSGVSSPLDALIPAECVDFGSGPEIVHSLFWPVINRRKWIVEADTLGYALFCGHYGLSEDYAVRYGSPQTRSVAAAEQLRRRVAHMVSAYSHPSCAAVLVNTDYEAENIRQWVSTLSLESESTPMLQKIAVYRPAVRPLAADRIERKWQDPAALNVVFCGRCFKSKNGPLTLNVFERLQQQFPETRFTYIGPIPEAAQERHRALMRHMVHFTSIDRASVQDLLADAHILFHPSAYESVGMALLEAAAAGTAIVTGAGPGMEHVTEWFSDGGAVLIDRAAADCDDESAFYAAMVHLLSTPAGARRHAMSNLRLCTSGALSIADRDRVLRRVYDAAINDAPGEPFTIAEMLGDTPHTVLQMSCADSMRMRAGYWAGLGRRPERVSIPVPV